MKYRYVNSQKYPVVLPTENRGKITFRPGEGSSKQWFSRFCGKKLLTAVPIGAPNPRRQTNLIPSTVEPIAPRVEIPEAKHSFPDITTSDYTLQRGIYTCVRCGIFKTGSKASLQAHIRYYHKVEPIEDETPLVSSKQSATKVEKDDDEPTPVVSTKPIVKPVVNPVEKQEETITEVPVVETTVFTCSVSGCGKSFKSERGLKLHNTKVHGTSNE